MTHYKCEHCGNVFHWHNAFSKFGYDDGEGDVQTHAVAEALEDAGYNATYSKWNLHNAVIYSIQKDGIEYMPLNDPRFQIGYDDPEDYLHEDILDFLDDEFLLATLFD